MIAIVGASGSGKTLSAILLAEGIQRVQPGPIVVVDTEALRALKHCNGNPDRFIHVPFGQPFGPLDYIAALTHAIKHQPSTVIVDSMSHEWEGPGGVLEQHAIVVDAKGQNYNQTAWIKPKADHTALKHFVLQQRCNWIFCFRAKEKTKPKADGKPEDLGWQPLGAEDLIWEMDLCALLYPGVDGRPRWKSPKLTEQEIMKLPGWWRAMFAGDPQLNPDIGEQLARWATGESLGTIATSSRTTAGATPAPSTPAADRILIDLFDACDSSELLDASKAEMKSRWDAVPPGAARTAVTKAWRDAEERVKALQGQQGQKPEGDPNGT